MAPRCALDEAGLRAQLARFRAVGRGARLLEQTPRRLVLEIDATIDGELLERAVAVERECCPFFALDWHPEQRRLAISVSAAEDEPAIDAIALALDMNAPT